MPVITIVGAQWGDEGKATIIEQLGARVDLLVRFGGGAHYVQSLVSNGERVATRLVPATALRHGSTCLLGQGMAIDPIVLLDELASLRAVDALKGQLFVCERAHVVMPHHQLLDQLRNEPEGASGAPRRGVGPCYADKIARRGIQIADLFRPEVFRARLSESVDAATPTIRALGHEPPALDPIVERYLALAEQLEPHVVDGSKSVLGFVRDRRNVVMEALLGTMVDIDHGYYPYVVGASTVASAAPIGTGVPPRVIDRVVGVAKAYSTRAGAGPFPLELGGAIAKHLVDRGQEVGATSMSRGGTRPRRCGMFGIPETRYAARVNGFDTLALTKLDVLTGLPEIPICVGYDVDGELIDEPPFDDVATAVPRIETLAGWAEPLGECRHYEELPAAARAYVERLEGATGLRVASIGVGPDRTIVRSDILA